MDVPPGHVVRALSDRNVLRRVYAELARVRIRVRDGALISDPIACKDAVEMIAAACNLIAGVGERLSREDPAWTNQD